MNSDSLFKKFLYKFITTDGSYVKLRSSLVERDLENAKLYSHTLKGIAANLGLVNLFDVSNNILSLLREGNLEEALRYEDALENNTMPCEISLLSFVLNLLYINYLILNKDYQYGYYHKNSNYRFDSQEVIPAIGYHGTYCRGFGGRKSGG